MYKVDVPKLKTKLDELNNLLENYQENYMNMYHQLEMSDQDELWFDPHARNFYDDKVIEKRNIESSYEELNEISDLINKIITMYANIGGIVEFDLSYRNSILSKFNIYKNKLLRIANTYSNLDYSFASSEIVSSINMLISDIKEQIRLSDLLKENITKIMDDIATYERDISKLIKNVDLEKIAFVEVEKYCTNDNNKEYEKCIIKPDEVGNVIKKLNLYSNLEDSNFIGILNIFKRVMELYKTQNTLSLEALSDNLNNKFNDIRDCNLNNIQVLERNIEKYTNIDKELTSDVDKIGA